MDVPKPPTLRAGALGKVIGPWLKQVTEGVTWKGYNSLPTSSRDSPRLLFSLPWAAFLPLCCPALEPANYGLKHEPE